MRTNSTCDFSAISIKSDFTNINFADRLNLEESLFYRKRFDKESKEKTVYSIFSLYKKNTSIGICPYGIDIDLMSEHFQKKKANKFRYWNKIRMGFKFLLQKNFNDTNERTIDYIIPELYFSYLHLPQSARGDLTTKVRKGSFMFSIMVTPTKRSLTYIKFNVGSTWVRPYFKQESMVFNKMENSSGISVEVEVNKNGYNHSIVESSRDIYRGITLFGGPEFNFTINRVFLNFGISITTENH